MFQSQISACLNVATFKARIWLAICEFLWLLANQNVCFFPFFLHWINPLLHWITWNCIYFNQSQVSNFPCILLMKKKRNKKNDTFHLQSFSKQKLRWLANLCSTIAAINHLPHFITPILKSLVVPVIWLALIGAICLRIALFFALNHILFPANKEATLNIKQWIRFPGLFKVTNQIAGKWNSKSIMWRILQLLFPKVVIEPRVVQFLSEVVLVISNRTRAAHSFNHEYYFSPNCAPLSSTSIIYSTLHRFLLTF